jgi:hypothetical protein
MKYAGHGMKNSLICEAMMSINIEEHNYVATLQPLFGGV